MQCYIKRIENINPVAYFDGHTEHPRARVKSVNFAHPKMSQHEIVLHKQYVYSLPSYCFEFQLMN